MLARQRPAGHEAAALDLPDPFGAVAAQADRLALGHAPQIEVGPVEEQRLVRESPGVPEHVEALPSRRDGVHGRVAGRAIEQIPTLVPGSCARRDVAVREGAIAAGGKVVIPGHHIGAVGLGGHRGSVGEDVGVHLLLGTERRQLGERAVACRAEPRRGEEQEERATSLVHKIMILLRRTAVICGEPTMKRAKIAGGAFAIVLVLVAAAAVYRARERDVHPTAAKSPAVPPATAPAVAETHPDFLYGRITTVDGATYEGRLRWGGDQEAFWGDYFNGFKGKKPWSTSVPPERLPKERRPIFKVLGVEMFQRERPIDLGRPFMARFGDIARIEARGKKVRVTLKSGTVFDGLDRFEASDFDDGLRVWDGRRGVVDLDSLRIRTVELLSTPSPGAAPYRLHGTVRTRQGDFTGFVQWNREECVGPDTLDGYTPKGKLSLRFDTIHSIARRSRDSALVTLLDGRGIALSGAPDVGHENRGIYVDDRRYGRVLVSWDAFERVDFSPGAPGDTGPAYGDFPPGRPLTGSVTTRAGRRLAGRLVYDLDESETTETLDAPSQGVDYTIPFGLIASIVVPPGREERARVTLQSGEELRLERAGDLGPGNAGTLIFVDGG